MKEDTIGCWGLIGAGILGVISIAAIGNTTYDWVTKWGIHTGVFTHDPVTNNQAEGIGEAMGLVLMAYTALFLYLITGLIVGVFTGVQFLRLRRYWSYQTRRHIILLTLLNGIATFVGAGILSGLGTVELFTTWSRSSEPVNLAYSRVTWVATILALGLLSLNLVMPWLVKSIAARR